MSLQNILSTMIVIKRAQHTGLEQGSNIDVRLAHSEHRGVDVPSAAMLELPGPEIHTSSDRALSELQLLGILELVGGSGCCDRRWDVGLLVCEKLVQSSADRTYLDDMEKLALVRRHLHRSLGLLFGRAHLEDSLRILKGLLIQSADLSGGQNATKVTNEAYILSLVASQSPIGIQRPSQGGSQKLAESRPQGRCSGSMPQSPSW
jgi:hypothetical protein